MQLHISSMTARLSTKLWIDAHLRVCFGTNMPSFVIAKGDPERGGVLIKVNHFESGVELFEQSLDFDGNKVWRRLSDEGGQEEKIVDEAISKRRRFDPDIWVLEIEDRLCSYVPDAPISIF